MCTAETYLRGHLVQSHLVIYKQAAVLSSQFCDLLEASVVTSVLESCGQLFLSSSCILYKQKL